MMSVSFFMAYRSFWKFWQASTPATIRRLLKTRHPHSRIAPGACGRPLFGKRYLRCFGGGFDRMCVRPPSVASHDATGRYAVRKAGVTSVQRAASARVPGCISRLAPRASVSPVPRRSLTPALRPCRGFALSGLGSRPRVILLFRRHGPDHAAHLVRERDGRDHLRLARHNCCQPAVYAAAMTNHERRAQIQAGTVQDTVIPPAGM